MRISDWSSDVCSSDLYARRQAVVTENPSAGTGYPLVRDVKAGSGVNVINVLRAYNSFLTNDARTAAGDYGRAEARQGWLTEIQAYFNTGTQGLSGRLTAFNNAPHDVAPDPPSRPAPDAFLPSAEGVL